MIHIKRQEDGQFYWLSVSKKANTFEENAKPTEAYTRKAKAIKSIHIEGKIFGGGEVWVADHTGKQPKFFIIEHPHTKPVPIAWAGLSYDQQREYEWAEARTVPYVKPDSNIVGTKKGGRNGGK